MENNAATQNVLNNGGLPNIKEWTKPIFLNLPLQKSHTFHDSLNILLGISEADLVEKVPEREHDRYTGWEKTGKYFSDLSYNAKLCLNGLTELREEYSIEDIQKLCKIIEKFDNAIENVKNLLPLSNRTDNCENGLLYRFNESKKLVLRHLEEIKDTYIKLS